METSIPFSPHDGAHRRPLAAADIARHLGDVDAETVTALLDTDATLADLLTAIAWAEGEDDAVGAGHRLLEGAAARIYDILAAADEPEEPRP
jgi:hypothetical protein